MQHPIETMHSVMTPDLRRRLAEYVGALKLYASGNVSAEFADEKLQALQLGCRTADRLLTMFASPEHGLAAVAARMHRRLTKPRNN